MKYANDNNFDEVRNLDKLTLVDFFATWCMPCQMQSEVLEKIDTSRGNDLEIVKINVDESPEISNEFEIESIPPAGFDTVSVVHSKDPPFNSKLIWNVPSTCSFTPHEHSPLTKL